MLACSSQDEGSLSWQPSSAADDTTDVQKTATPDEQLSELPEFLPFGDGALRIPDELAGLGDRLNSDDITPYGSSDDTGGYWSKLVPDPAAAPIFNDINDGALGVINFGMALTPKSLTNPNWLYSPLKLLDSQLKLMLLDGNSIETSATLYINRLSSMNVAMGLGIGKVGIGTEPNAKLHIKGSTVGDPAENTELRIEASAVEKNASLKLCGQVHEKDVRCSDSFQFKYYGGEDAYMNVETWTGGEFARLMTWYSSTSLHTGVGIGSFDSLEERRLLQDNLLTVKGSVAAESMKVDGTISSGSLAVAGTIEAREVIVREDVGGADFVFSDDYSPMSLAETERFVRENRHLPHIPSAADSAKNGVSVGEYQTRLLQTVEELTLHVIAQSKRIDELERVLDAAPESHGEQTCEMR